MKKEQIKLNQLEMLVSIVDSGSFNAAALKLGCTQSRLSYAIGELESKVGARLLNRSHTGCTPTLIGQAVILKARQILSIADSVIHTKLNSGMLSGCVRVACFRSVAAHILPYTIERLSESYPGIQLEVNDGCLDYEDVTKCVKEKRADIGVTRGPFDDSLISYPYIQDNYVFVVPVHYKIDYPVTWDQFAGLPFIQTQNPGSRWILDQCIAAGFMQKVSRTLVTDSGVIAMVRRGLGYTILPKLTIFSDNMGIKLIDLPIAVTRSLSIITAPDHSQPELMRATLRELRNREILSKTEVFRSKIVAADF